MAATDTVRTHFHTVLLADRIGRVLARAYGRVKAWDEARLTRKLLSALSDAELKDIGLKRSDIDIIANRR